MSNSTALRYRIRKSTADDGSTLVSIWRSSVVGTHSFVSAEDLAAIDQEVQRFLPASQVWIALDNAAQPIGFMGLAGDVIESLFIAGEQRGRGAGRALVEYAMQKSASLVTEVNEQNDQAVGFYRHFGFIVKGRSPTDGQGLPYPILQMLWER